MTDDSWRRGRRDDDDDDFGPPLFADEPTGEVRDISFGDSDTGPLPHWTQPPTGEIPRTLGGASPDPTDDLDVWSSFSGQAPVWRDDRGSDPSASIEDLSGGVRIPSAAAYPIDEEPVFATDETGRDPSAPVRREPGRITIGTDPTDNPQRSGVAPRRGRPGEPPPRGQRPGQRQPARPAKSAGRDMPTAVAVGLLMAAAFIAAVKISHALVLVIILLVLGLSAFEYFEKVTEKGYRPAFSIGVAACVGLPLAMYWLGAAGIIAMPLVLVLVFIGASVAYIGADGVESAPMPNMAITVLGVLWIGFLGSFAVLILQAGPGLRTHHVGTDTLTLMAIAVVANDTGAFFLGSVAGRTPLRAWISPNKSVEGLIGGTLTTLVVMLLIGISGVSKSWHSTGHLLLLGLIVSLVAPLGDLTESMFKRNLEIKDFGTMVRGHGGVLDRFDAFLFALPATYYLLITLRPFLK